MRMRRYFFISSDLADLERMEEELESAGVVTPQIHVLTLDDAGAANHHHLHTVVSLMKKDIVHSTLIGAAVGVFAAVLSLIVAWAAGWTDTAAGWTPFIFLAIILLGFFTWEGGLRGIDKPNVHFKAFEKALQEGNHVFFVDLDPGQEKVLEPIIRKHPSLQAAGTAHGSSHWIVLMQYRVKRFFSEIFP